MIWFLFIYATISSVKLITRTPCLRKPSKKPLINLNHLNVRAYTYVLPALALLFELLELLAPPLLVADQGAPALPRIDGALAPPMFIWLFCSDEEEDEDA